MAAKWLSLPFLELEKKSHMVNAEKPVMSIMAGTNGSGKSTLTQVLKPSLGFIVDPDAIARTIDSVNPEAVSVKAGRQTLNLVRDLIKHKTSFSIETTLAGGNAIRQIQEAIKAGYEIRLYYVGLESVEINVERVAARVARGGHNIPETDIRRRYQRSLDNLLEVCDLCDIISVYDNSYEFETIIQYRKGILVVTNTVIPTWAKPVVEKLGVLIGPSNFFS